MGIAGIEQGSGYTNKIDYSSKKRVIGKYCYANGTVMEKVKGGNMADSSPVFSYGNPKTGEKVEIYRAENYAEDNPLYILKGIDKKGRAYRTGVHAWTINPNNCTYNEMKILNMELGNTTSGNDDRIDALFARTGAESFFEKTGFYSALQETIDEYEAMGNWDGYLSMDKWKQSLDDHISTPVYFDRELMQANSTGECSFATVTTAEAIQKEIDNKIKAFEKSLPPWREQLRQTLANTYPNATKLMYREAGSSRLMNFDEYVKNTEKMLEDLLGLK